MLKLVVGAPPDPAAPALGSARAGTSATGPAPAPDDVLELVQPAEGAPTTASPGLDLGDLATSIARPLAAGNGDYSVQVSLHPPELGEVRALLSLQGDVLHVTLTPEHAAGFDASSDAMPALHEQLAGGGLEVNVTLGQPGDTPGGDEHPGPARGHVGAAPPDEAAPSPTTPAVAITSDGPGRIHLVL